MAATATTPLTQVQRLYLAARDKSVPLVVMRTVDPAACVRALDPVTKDGDDRPAPLVQWTCTSGYESVNGPGVGALRPLGATPNTIINPVDALMKAKQLPDFTTVVFQNLGAYWNDPRVRQAFWSLRDELKRNWRMAIVMGMDAAVPPTLEHDVLLIDAPLPGAAELGDIVRAQYTAARLSAKPTDAEVARAVDALAGLSTFAAEQATALSLRTRGLDFDALRDRHRQMIENTPGLHVWKGGETFANVGGLRAFIGFAERLLGAGVYRPGAVLWVDEIEKALAGIKGDLTGIAQDYLSTLLQFMQNGSVPGILLMGHPGTGKSLLAKAFGASAGAPTIHMDLGAMHGSLVGQSQHALRHALDVGNAVSQGRPIVIATCNSVAVLPPELINRFPWRFFVDFPTEEEKATIWPIHLTRLKLDAKQAKPDAGEWNGREIAQCCETAAMLKCSLTEAAQYVVPIAESSAELIEQRRLEAAGRYLSASVPGPYAYRGKEHLKIGDRQIRVAVDDDPKWVAPPSSGKAN